ncbi:MAG: sulfatase family protein, partial [Solirubrobacterales bacterium]
ALLAGGPGGPEPAAAGAQSPPNIVVLYTDDQEPESLKVMNTVADQLKAKGVTMKRFYNNFPLCCPSRATLLTGQYAHNHDILSNQSPEGGFGKFDELHGNNYLPLWLQQAGYTTSFIGKFMNEYAVPDEYGTTPTTVPRGWNDWRALAPARAQYFDYTLNQNGVLTRFGNRNRDYSTDVFTTKAKKFIRRTAPGPSPFFLMLGYAAPHGGGGGSPGRSCNRGARPAPRHLRALRKLDKKERFEFPPSFNEAKITDKPSSVQQMPPLTAGQIRDLKRKRRCAWESLLAVDESVDEITAELKRSGENRDTYVFFLSDNGILRGEHRIRNQKRYLYEESARVPFIVRGPGVARGKSSFDVVANADLTSTLLQIAGASPGLTQDGRSLIPNFSNPKAESGRAILLEAYAGQEIIGLRTSRYLYAEWDTELPQTELELYDTYADRYQLQNLAYDPRYGGVVADLGNQLDDLIDCAGPECSVGRTAQLSFPTTGGSGPKGCTREPVVARLNPGNADDVASVSFRAGKKATPEDYAPPYEAVLPYGAIRRALPKAADVLGVAVYDDGRRVAVPAKLRACARK